VGGLARAVPEHATPLILATKLYRPAPPPDAIARDVLTEWLERGSSLPLTLVSAPAGYGKTTLVAQWLADSETPSAWLQLDENDKDLGHFLEHLVAAVRSVYPDALAETKALVAAQVFPPVSIVVRTLLNELDGLVPQRLILALDDYHAIDSGPVDELLTDLLQHPPRHVHLVLMSRVDPQLPLALLRGRGQLAEFRAHDLRLEPPETAAFITAATGHEPDSVTISALEERTEGWIAGLRFAVQAVRATGGDLGSVAGIGPLDGPTREFLVSEVLDAQPAEIREYMMASAVPERFSAGLCEALLGGAGGPAMEQVSGQGFIDWVVSTGCFVVPLDVEGTWYRYHHLFANLLRRRWKQGQGSAELLELHRRAGAWFAAHGTVEEALDHLLAANETHAAATLVADRGTVASDLDEWSRIRRWLDRLPREVVLDDARLQVLEAWQRQAGAEDVPGAMADTERAAALLKAGRVEPAARDQVEGSVEALRAFAAIAVGDVSPAIEHSQRALDVLPAHPTRPAAFAKMLQIVALQMSGDPGAAGACAIESMADASFRGRRHAPWPFALAYVALLEADRRALLRHGRELRDLGTREGYGDARRHGGYFMGVAHYLGDDLDGAQAHFEQVMADRYIGRPLVCLNATIAYTLTRQAQGRDDEAASAAEIAGDYLLDYASPQLQRLGAAFQAAFAARDGRMAEAARWADAFEPGPPMLEFHLFSPSLALIEVLLATGREPDLDRAIGLLDEFQAYAERVHNRLQLIQALSLRALASAARDDAAQALEALRRAVALSHPGEAIRAVADRGPGLVPLLNRLEVEGEELTHVAAVLAAVGGPATAGATGLGPIGVPDPAGLPALTPRELAVLSLLDRRYSNKEIARELHVAPETVKKYTISIYEKLNVKGRHEAAAKGRALGYLQPPAQAPHPEAT